MRIIATVAIPVMLSGCAVPVGLSVAGYAADGLSLSASGKSVNDHLISQVLNMDCGLFRFLKGDSICRERGVDPDDDTIYLAEAETIDGPPRPWGTAEIPNFQYEDHEDDDDARGWAEGIALVQAPLSDDASGRMAMNRPRLAAPQMESNYIGALSAKRDRDRKIENVRDRLEMVARERQGGTDPRYVAAGESGTSVTPRIVDAEQLGFHDSLGLSAKMAAPVMPVTVAAFMPVAAAAGPVSRPAANVASATSHAEVPAALAAKVVEPAPRAESQRVVRTADSYYLVVGSFDERGQASRLAAQSTSVALAVVPAAVNDRQYFRLIAGPVARDGVDDLQRSLSAVGFRDQWAIKPCGDAPAKASCLSAEQTALVEDSRNLQVAIAD